MTHAELEAELDRRGRDLLRELFQARLDIRAMSKPRAEEVNDADGVRHGAVEAGHTRPLQTIFGTVTVGRLAYRHRGHANLFPADAQLNLPQERHSHGLRRLAAIEGARGSFAEATAAIGRATGQRVGKRQVEALAARAAVDIEDFYLARRALAGEAGDVLVISADGKGIVMRPEALRPQTARKAQTATTKLKTRLSKGEKRNRKRLAEVGAVYDLTAVPRRAADIMCGRDTDQPPGPGPVAKNKWVTASVVGDAAEVLSDVFDEAQRRDPGHARRWVALVDGNNHQIDRIATEAAQRGVTVTVVVDFIHVLEYLWGAAWCFFEETDTDAEAWVRDRALGILNAGAAQVAAGIRRRATTRATNHEAHQGRRVRPLPRQQGPLPGLPHRTRCRLADRHRRDRRSLPPPRQGPHGHHRRTLERPRRRSCAQATSRPHQRRLRRLLGLPPRSR